MSLDKSLGTNNPELIITERKQLVGHSSLFCLAGFFSRSQFLMVAPLHPQPPNLRIFRPLTFSLSQQLKATLLAPHPTHTNPRSSLLFPLPAYFAFVARKRKDQEAVASRHKARPAPVVATFKFWPALTHSLARTHSLTRTHSPSPTHPLTPLSCRNRISQLL